MDNFNKIHSGLDLEDERHTVVAVRILKHGLEKLISRSQAKTLLARFDRFKAKTDCADRTDP